MSSIDLVDLTLELSPEPSSRPQSAKPSKSDPHDQHWQRYIRCYWAGLDRTSRAEANGLLRRSASDAQAPNAQQLAVLPQRSLRIIYTLVYRSRHPVKEKSLAGSTPKALPPSESHNPSARSESSRRQQQHPATRERNDPVPHPDHVRNIVQTSSSSALRSVLIELCKSSPALSRATVRCLAPHSSFAQATIKRAAAGGHPAMTPRMVRSGPLNTESRLQQTWKPSSVKTEDPSVASASHRRTEHAVPIKRQCTPLNWSGPRSDHSLRVFDHESDAGFDTDPDTESGSESDSESATASLGPQWQPSRHIDGQSRLAGRKRKAERGF